MPRNKLLMPSYNQHLPPGHSTRSRASHTVANAPNPSFCSTRYRGALDPSDAQVPGGQDVAEDDWVVAVLSVHGEVLVAQVISVHEEEVLVLAESWVGPWGGGARWRRWCRGRPGRRGRLQMAPDGSRPF